MAFEAQIYSENAFLKKRLKLEGEIMMYGLLFFQRIPGRLER